MRFIEATNGDRINLDHVAKFVPERYRTRNDRQRVEAYAALSTDGGRLGTVDAWDVGLLEGVPTITVPNTTSCNLIVFWFDREGTCWTQRRPILGWKLYSLTDGSEPITFEGITQSEYCQWFIELPENTDGRYVHPEDCSFLTLDEARNHAKAVFEEKRAKRQREEEKLPDPEPLTAKEA